MYQKELRAIKKSNRYRELRVVNEKSIDLASNDYLGLSQIDEIFDTAVKNIKSFKYHSPKASLLVDGYHQVHKNFEDYLSKINNFESCIVAGSGFLANIALIEALPRKKDILIIDKEYHASGILASKLVEGRVEVFEHNDPESLKNILSSCRYNRAIVAVEGIYSMSGEVLNREIFDVCDEYGAILIVDEAHSVGVVGDNLLGVFDLYNITPKPNHIKMGTLGKALGSYGAYILSSSHIKEYLQNRAKSLIYTTAPSLVDIELARVGFEYIAKNLHILKEKIAKKRDTIVTFFDYNMQGLIFPYQVDSIDRLMKVQKKLEEKGFKVGAIRPPTVEKAMLRITPRVGVSDEEFEKFCEILRKEI